MARVSGPLMSVAASGTYAKTLVFSTWKGRPYVRERVTPSNPKSAKQTGVRAMMAYLAKIWATIKATAETSWDAAATAASDSPFNAYIAANLKNWQMNLAPTRLSTDARAAAASTITSNIATGGKGQATVAIVLGAGAGQAGAIVMRSGTAITTFDWSKVIAIVPATASATTTVTDSPLNPGTYHYNVITFSTDGKLGVIGTDESATAT